MQGIISRMSAGDEEQELLDVLDETGKPTGEKKQRGKVHSDGDWHRSFHLWVVSPEGLVLFQRRAPGKLIEPGRIDVSVGGHFTAGEGLEDVLREVEEELGFLPEVSDLSKLTERHTERFYEGAIDREYQDVYALVRDVPLDSYQLNCSEVTVVYELPVAGAIELFRDGTPLAAAGWDCQGRVNNALLVEDDLIQRARDETVKVLGLLQEWLES